MSDKHKDAQGELLPCPLCGSQPKLADMAGWEIVCQCGINLCLATPTIAPLIAAWNRRATESQAQTSRDFDAAFQFVYEAYGAPADKFADYGEAYISMRDKVTKAFSIMQKIRAAQLADSTALGAPVDISKVGNDLDGVPQPFAGAIVLLETIAQCGALGFFADGSATPNHHLCLRIAEELREAGKVSAAPTAQQSLTAGGAVLKPCGWLAGSGSDGSSVMYWTLEAAQRECDEHNAYERSRPDFDEIDLRFPEAVYLAAPLPQVQSEAIPDLYIGKWSFSTDEENFSGELDSEQDAIAEATAQGYEKFWVGQCVHPVETLPDAQSIGESVIEEAEEWAADECGGDDRIFDLNKDDATKLGKMVRDFIKREASVQRYGVINITLHQPDIDQQPVTPSGALADNDGGVA